MFICIICLVLISYFLVDLDNKIIVALIIVSILSLSEVIQLFFLILNYESIGIVNVDKTTIKGFDYKQSIQSVTSDLKFIGVGSHKLTKNVDEFTAMVKRVDSSGQEVRLILCHPESESLKELANRADLNPNLYSNRVIESLRIIKNIKSQGFRIKVRLYKSSTLDEMPVFRVMLINKNHCLLAYSHFNDSSHQGHILPQLHLRKQDDDILNNFSLYTAFQKHFKQFWNDPNLEEWNYKDYI